MKTILLMRHSNALSHNSALADHERPLSDRGKQLAKATAELLVNQFPDRILCSSAVRTRETAEVVANVSDASVVAEPVDQLYLAPAARYLTAGADRMRANEQSVLMVGHNPGIASLISSWADESLLISPCTVAIFQVNVDDWASLTQLSSYVPTLTGLIIDGIRVR